jgi:hypothetical protein
MNMDTHRINGGQMTVNAPYTPKVRKPQRGIIKSRTNADKTTRAVRLAKDLWLIERLVCGDWVDVCELIQYSTGVYQIVGSKQKHHTLTDAMNESEGMPI